MREKVVERDLSNAQLAADLAALQLSTFYRCNDVGDCHTKTLSHLLWRKYLRAHLPPARLLQAAEAACQATEAALMPPVRLGRRRASFAAPWQSDRHLGGNAPAPPPPLSHALAHLIFHKVVQVTDHAHAGTLVDGLLDFWRARRHSQE